MTNPFPRFAGLRATLLGALAVALVAAACETPMPTTAEVEAMDVAAAERRAVPLLQDVDAYYVDGRQVSRAEAQALAPEQIARIEVRKTPDQGEIRIVTVGSPEAGTAEQPGRVQFRVQSAPAGEERVEVWAPSRDPQAGARVQLRGPNPSFDGLILIDGQVATPAQMGDLGPDRIVSVEVIKGAAAAQHHTDPRAANGIIRITTRPAAGN